MSQKPPSTRIAMPDSRPAIIGLILALLGGMMVSLRTEQFRDLGWALVVIGFCTIGWWVSQANRVRIYRRELDREAERKSRLNVTRRQKEEEERAQRDAEKKTREEQAARIKEQRAEESRKRKEADEAAMREGAERAARVEAEITRIKSLEPEALRQEVITRMSLRGYGELSAQGDWDGLFFHTPDNERAVCRIVSTHSGRAADVRDVESGRRDLGATEAFVVSLHGFAPDAVRAAQGKPITLVEAHLLATWSEEQAAASPG